jgi:uncharacterized membrane protein (DUF4010 family)
MLEYVNPELLGIALALALGLLIGLEREWSDAAGIGLRTFALLGGAGATAAVLAGHYGELVVVAALLVAGALLVVLARPAAPKKSFKGATTAIAALITFLVGAMAVSGLWLEAVVLAAATMLLLHWKEPLHRWVDHIGPEDFEIIARFTLIALVVLPVLPNRTFGPYDVFNPFQSWLFVVLIVGINIAGYLLFRFSSKSSSLWLAGALGGMISSTATTISYAAISKRQSRFGAEATLVILMASAVVYGRVLFELFLVAPELIGLAVGPMALLTAILALLALVASRHVSSEAVRMPEVKNPAQFKLALGVAVAFVVILFAVALTRDLIGGQAIYLVATVSGLTDVDALTLSVARHFSEGALPAESSWRAIFLATLANLTFKTGAAAILGSADLRRWMLASGACAVVAGLLILFAWP